MEVGVTGDTGGKWTPVKECIGLKLKYKKKICNCVSHYDSIHTIFNYVKKILRKPKDYSNSRGKALEKKDVSRILGQPRNQTRL